MPLEAMAYPTPDARADEMISRFDPKDAQGLLADVLTDGAPIALVCSFGAESVVLLHMIAAIDTATPILFLETGMLFPETLAYQKSLAAHFGLTNIKVIRPAAEDVASRDVDGTLHIRDHDGCCDIRKVRPLERALTPYQGWITGRKRIHGGQRKALDLAEVEGNRLKLNPLAHWDGDEVRAYMDAHDLPRHPLANKGFASIGCAPCTSPVQEGEDPRAGRWRGSEKQECGIHFIDGKAVRI